MNTKKPIKPLLRYHGGKWIAAKKIIPHFPPHRIYVEPFGGAASILLQKDRSESETYNDLDDVIVNLFRVLQDRSLFADLEHKLSFTPYSRSEFELAYEDTTDRVEQARRLLIRSWQGHSTVGAHRKTGYRTNMKYVRRSFPPGDWIRLIEHLDLVVDRLRGVNIENRDAIEVITGHDVEDALIYADPPYTLDQRHGKVYRHEMTDSQHRDLIQTLKDCKSMVILSGYRNPIYDKMLNDWHSIEFNALADGASPRIETIWMNESAQTALEKSNIADHGPEQLLLAI